MKILQNISIIIILLFVYSCANEVLNTKPLDAYTEEGVWTDPDLAQGFVYAAQSDVIDEFLKFPDESNGLGDVFTDNQVLSGGSGNIRNDLIDMFYDAGWDAFDVIRESNKIIEKVSSNNTFTEKEKNNLLGQGYFLRALIYFNQARLFGKYIIIDKVLTTEDEFELPRSPTIKDTYDFILSDLTNAGKYLPADGVSGTITKGAALALKAEVALHGAAYIESGKEDYYQISKQASEDLFALDKYSLDEDYKGMFNSYSGGLNSPEIILAYYKNDDITKFKNTPMIRLVPNCDATKNYSWVKPVLTEDFSGWGRYYPSTSLVDDYLVTDADNVAKKWDETSFYSSWKLNGGYVSNAIYKNRDNRFDASVVRDSTQFFTNTVTTRIGGNLHWSSNAQANWGMTCSGYYQRKGVYEENHLSGNDYTNYHYVLLRLGRSYLNYAEVMLRLNQPSTAIEYINKTRSKHGGLPELSTGLSLEDAWKWYKIERRVDLFCESDRYWSLLRWGKEAGSIVIPELNTNERAFEISEDGKSFEFVEIPNGYDIRNELNFSERRYLFPVPEKQRQLNPSLDQNPGW